MPHTPHVTSTVPRREAGPSRRPICSRVLALLALLVASCGAPPPPTTPNVLLYIVDTLRADSLGYYGDPQARTPQIDRFAAEGVIFEQARAHSSWTRPSVASIFTGQNPPRHRVESRADRLSEEASTIAELLSAAGFDTAFITTNPNVGSFFGFGQGFDRMLELYARRAAGRIDESELVTRADEVTRRAIAWLESARRPFFLVVLSVDPHFPYRPPAAFAPPERPEKPRVAPDGMPDAPTQRYVRSRYQGEVAANDAAFGALIDHLREAGSLDDTIAILTSDHGEEFWEHGGILHGKTLYDEMLHVPLVIRYPRAAALESGTRITSPVRSIDILPTLLDLLGLPPHSPAEGRSLARLDGDAPVSIASLHDEDRELRAVTAPPWKLHLDVSTGETTLFDLASQAAERIPADPAQDPEARAALEALLPELEVDAREDATDAEADDHALPEDARKTLEALGYLE